MPSRYCSGSLKDSAEYSPGRGIGANTALRDARLLCHNLTAARDGKIPLLTAIRDYETQMIGYGFDAVRKSRKQMTASNPVHTPVIGRAMLAGMRTINHLPPSRTPWPATTAPTADTTATTNSSPPNTCPHRTELANPGAASYPSGRNVARAESAIRRAPLMKVPRRLGSSM